MWSLILRFGVYFIFFSLSRVIMARCCRTLVVFSRVMYLKVRLHSDWLAIRLASSLLRLSYDVSFLDFMDSTRWNSICIREARTNTNWSEDSIEKKKSYMGVFALSDDAQWGVRWVGIRLLLTVSWTCNVSTTLHQDRPWVLILLEMIRVKNHSCQQIDFFDSLSYPFNVDSWLDFECLINKSSVTFVLLRISTRSSVRLPSNFSISL